MTCDQTFEFSHSVSHGLVLRKFAKVSTFCYSRGKESHPSPSRYTCVSLHMGITRPMVQWSLQGGGTEEIKWFYYPLHLNFLCYATHPHPHPTHTHLSELGKSMPRSKLSSLLPRVETMIRYLTLTELMDSSCTAYKTREAAEDI